MNLCCQFKCLSRILSHLVHNLDLLLFKVPMKRNLVFRFFQYFKSLNTKTCLAFQKFEIPAIKLKINRHLSPICGELCLRGQRVQ